MKRLKLPDSMPTDIEESHAFGSFRPSLVPKNMVTFGGEDPVSVTSPRRLAEVAVTPLALRFPTMGAVTAVVENVPVAGAQAMPPEFTAAALKKYEVVEVRLLISMEEVPLTTPREIELLQFAGLVPPSLVP